MNMVKVFIKGQEDKELSSFLRYYPTRIKNVGIDGVFDRQTIFDFKDGCNQPQVAQFVAKELVRKFGRKIGKVVFSCVPTRLSLHLYVSCREPSMAFPMSRSMESGLQFMAQR